MSFEPAFQPCGPVGRPRSANPRKPRASWLGDRRSRRARLRAGVSCRCLMVSEPNVATEFEFACGKSQIAGLPLHRPGRPRQMDVRDRRLQTIGEFANRREALHFAMFESDPTPQAVIASVGSVTGWSSRKAGWKNYRAPPPKRAPREGGAERHSTPACTTPFGNLPRRADCGPSTRGKPPSRPERQLSGRIRASKEPL
jgi:hypothetical protein